MKRFTAKVNVTTDDYHCSMTVQEAYRQLSAALQTIYEHREAVNIANIVTEHITGFGNTSRLVNKHTIINKNEEEKFIQITSQLLSRKPLQYVLQEAPFYGMKLYVDEHVLIPRPETEELVEWILSDAKSQKSKVSILDIGTGSGCIPVAIKKNLPATEVYAIDISEKALQVAKRNAEEQKVTVRYYGVDILDEQQWQLLPTFDYIISNPPYIAQSEAAFMHENVLKYEPHIALFVPDNDPLLFYNAISSFGVQHANKNGKLFFEINEAFGKDVIELLTIKGYTNIELKKDMQGKDRMIKAVAPAF